MQQSDSLPQATAYDTRLSGKLNVLESLGYEKRELNLLGDLYELYTQTEKARTAFEHGGTAEGRSIRARFFRDWLTRVYQIKKTASPTDASTIYYIRRRAPRFDGDGALTMESVVFTPQSAVQFKAFVTTLWSALFPRYTASADFKEAYATLTQSVNDLLEQLSDRWLYVGRGLALDRADPSSAEDAPVITDMNTWVTEELEWVKQVPDVFYRLFDTSPKAVKGDNDIVMVPELTKEMVETLRGSYDRTLEALKTNGAIPKEERLEEIMQWAQGEYDRYVDIVHMASARLKKHDYGVYLLAGLGRDGKSSCIDLVASLYGTNNACRVPIDKLGDTHNLSNFQRALVNLPDEQKPSDGREKTMSADASVAFRVAGSHGAVNMNVMCSNKSDELYYSFVTMAPVNSVPKFPADVQNACIRRCRIIEFEGDFSASDNRAVKWGKEHFTPTFMMRFAGQVLAFASYYSVNDWKDTTLMELARQKQYENSGSSVMYIKLWEKLYCGYDSYKTIRDDYYNYCALSDYEKDEFNRGSILLMPYSQRMRITADPIGSIQVLVKKSEADKVKNKTTKKQLMLKNGRGDIVRGGKTINLTGGKTIEDFHKSGGSIVFQAEEMGLLDEDPQQKLPLKEKA